MHAISDEAADTRWLLWTFSFFTTIFTFGLCFAVNDDSSVRVPLIMPMNLLRLFMILGFALFAMVMLCVRSTVAKSICYFQNLVHILLTLSIAIVPPVGYLSEQGQDDAASGSGGILLITGPAVVELVILMLLRIRLIFSQKTELAEVTAVELESRTWSAADDATNKQDTCVICLDEFEEGVPIRRAPCSHIFHDHCIRTWQSHHEVRNRLCPYRCEDMTLSNSSSRIVV